MKKMRTVSSILAFILTLSLMEGCSLINQGSPSPSEQQDESPSPSPDDEGLEKITVDIFQYQPEYSGALEDAVREYIKDKKDVKINIETVGKDQDYSAALRAKFNSNIAPAIFNIGSPKDLAEWKSKLVDLTGSDITKQVIEGYLKGVTQDDKIYGLPYLIQGFGLICNMKIVEQAQIELKDVDTFSALEDMVQTLDKQKEELKLDAVFALPAKEKGFLGQLLPDLYIAPEFDNDIFKTFGSKTIEFTYTTDFKKMVDLLNKYSVQPSTEMDYQSQVDYLFSTGKVAMIPQGNWAYESIKLIDKELAQTGIQFIPFPLGERKEPAMSVGVPMYWVFNNAKPEQVQKEAVDFISWLYISDAGKKVIKEQFKFVAPYKGYSGDAIDDPLGKDVMYQANAGTTANWVFQAYPPGFSDKLATDLQQYLKGTLSWDEVTRNAENNWTDARK